VRYATPSAGDHVGVRRITDFLAVFRRGAAAAWVRADLEAVLEPYRLRSLRATQARRSMRRWSRRAKR
jgi:hypothetical protein